MNSTKDAKYFRLTSCSALPTVDAFCRAVEMSRSSKFVHEEGLCHELAGMHYEGLNKLQQALTSFQQAKTCYNKWGSQMKVSNMDEKIQNILYKTSSIYHQQVIQRGIYYTK